MGGGENGTVEMKRVVNRRVITAGRGVVRDWREGANIRVGDCCGHVMGLGDECYECEGIKY